MQYASANWDVLRLMGLARKSRNIGFNPVIVSNETEFVERECAGHTVEVKVRKAHIARGQRIVLDEQGRDTRINFPSDDMSEHYLEPEDQNTIILARHNKREKQRQKRKRRRAKKTRKAA